MNVQAPTNNIDNNLIRSMVRGSYDMQQLRIQMGNRITANFKTKLGITPDGMSENELEKAEKKVLDTLRDSYRRITDGIIAEGEESVTGKLPSQKKFKGDEIISTYTELVLVDQYMTLLRDEEKQFSNLGKIMVGIPIYDTFLSQIQGIGPAMAGIIISEIDITKAEYSSSLWKYAGLDVVTYGKYTDDKGKEHTLTAWEIEAYFNRKGESGEMLAEGKYPVTYHDAGRSRRDFCLVDRVYTTKEGDEATKKSITYNPFLKTKLIGVLGSSLLRSGKNATVDGKRLGGVKRLELAKEKGFVKNKESSASTDDQVTDFLRMLGHEVKVEMSPYAEVYYNYKNRLSNDPRHKEKSEGHRHNMAVRYMVKRFLVNLYAAWRPLEGLIAAEEYSVAKLGLVHGKAK